MYGFYSGKFGCLQPGSCRRQKEGESRARREKTQSNGADKVDREPKIESTDDKADGSVKPMVGTAPNNENTRVVRNKVSPKKGAPNGCDTCGKSYKRRDVLKRHMLIHSTESHVRCDICGKICLRKDTLKRHLRVHSPGVPFECDVCGRTFKRKDALKEHKKGTLKAGRCIPPSVGEVNQKKILS